MSESFATALDSLGTFLQSDPGRDAIHLATYAVTAAGRLNPGQHIGFVDGGVGANAKELLGIVDPFLAGSVFPGQMFWMVLYPRTITSLRHVWTHPAFSGETPDTPVSSKEASEAWLRDFISTAGCPSYETVIAAAVDGTNAWDEDYMHFNDQDAHGEIPAEFWGHVEMVTGKTITLRPKYFSCAC